MRRQYLEELHKSVANADHTTLLLNCYTKLLSSTPSGDAKDALKQKLQRFIRGEMAADDAGSSGADRDARELKFDVEAAINALRAAGYYDEALFLARKHSKHENFLRLQLYDRHDFKVRANQFPFVLLLFLFLFSSFLPFPLLFVVPGGARLHRTLSHERG